MIISNLIKQNDKQEYRSQIILTTSLHSEFILQ